MDCQNFRRLHSDFIDRTLSELLVAALYLHLQGCANCARRDAILRRGLFVARNLPEVRPSAGFARKLLQRLDAERNPGRIPGRIPRPTRTEFALRLAGTAPALQQRAALS